MTWERKLGRRPVYWVRILLAMLAVYALTNYLIVGRIRRKVYLLVSPQGQWWPCLHQLAEIDRRR